MVVVTVVIEVVVVMVMMVVVSGVGGQEPHCHHAEVLSFAVVVDVLEAVHGVVISVARARSRCAHYEDRNTGGVCWRLGSVEEDTEFVQELEDEVAIRRA